MMSRSVPQIIVLFTLLIYWIGSLGSNLGVGEPRIRCKEAERQALLRIKDDLCNSTDGTYLPSWGSEEDKRECCEWNGVSCDSKSGHVIRLDLSNENASCLFIGNMSSALVELQHLNYLDLSGSYSGGNFIPNFIGKLSKLRYLNLSCSLLVGEIPRQLGNLSSLQYLDLSSNFLLNIKSLESISRLSSLRLLDLSSTNMSMAHGWVHVVNNLPHLINLRLSESELPDAVPPSLSLVNSSKSLAVLNLHLNPLSTSVFLWLFNYSRSLVHLDLSDCLLSSSIPEAFGNLAALEYLDLTFSDLEGSIPKSFGNMTALAYLDLSNNQLEGSILEGFGNMTSLQSLNLSNNILSGEIPRSIWKGCSLQQFQASYNSLSGLLRFAESATRCAHFPLEVLNLKMNGIVGSLPNFTLYPSLKEIWLNSNQLNRNTSKSIGQLSHLEILDLSNNSMVDVMSEAHFSKLFNLTWLDLSSNSHIVFNISSDWIPPFQLRDIKLGGCKLGPHFPKWLLTQNSIQTLNISYAEISDNIPDALWNLLKLPYDLDLSNNEIRGTIQDHQGSNNIFINSIDLSSNHLEGPIPAFILGVSSLNLFNNTFSDINSFCNNNTPWGVEFLDVSYNRLSGELPDCWSGMDHLRVLNLGNNKLSGKIPTAIGSLLEIQILHLGNNNLTAELPSSLKNCEELVIFDVGENELLGAVPTWIGKSLTKLVILSLRANHFNGSVPIELCHLGDLQLLDLSSNNLARNIPNCLGNITAMKAIEGAPSTIILAHFFSNSVPPDFIETLFLVWKGVLLAFKNLGLLKSIDLSSNKLSGEIPREITQLVGLVSLNLSRNNLSGQIPQEIGKLKSLDALDLSRNHLFGRIPSSVTQIDRLNTLDLSTNNLSGKIPEGPQLQYRDPDAYLENPELCGVPLPKKCSGEEEPTISGGTEDHADDQEKHELITRGFYISAAIGFIVAFWGFCLTLIFNKSWRYRYFKSLSNAGDWLYVTVAVHKAKLLRIIKS